MEMYTWVLVESEGKYFQLSLLIVCLDFFLFGSFIEEIYSQALVLCDY